MFRVKVTSVVLTDSECVEATADDDGDGQELAEAEDVLHGGGQAHAQTVDQGDNSWKRSILLSRSSQSFSLAHH